MPSRPQLTILLLTSTRVLRADFSSGASRLLGQWRGERPRGASLETAAELALGLGPKPGRRLFILTTDAWTQIATLDLQASRSMSGEELTQALKFEVESYSDLPAFESQAAQVELAAKRDSGLREFWVTQLPSRDMAELEGAARRRGAKLAGVGHPAGAPGPLAEDSPSDQSPVEGSAGGAAWQRLEFWGEVICCLGSAEEAGVVVVQADARSDRWQAALARHCDPQAATEWLLGPGETPPARYGGEQRFPLDDEHAAARWFTAWARRFASAERTTPLLAPERPPLTPRDRISRAVAGAALAVLLCGLHWGYGQWTLAALTAEREKLTEAETQNKGFTTRLAQVQKEQKAAEEELAVVREERRRLAALGPWRSRHLELLRFLAVSANENVVIEQIAPHEQGLQLSGLALTSDGAMWLASDLRRCAARHGWEVHLPAQSGRNQLENGGPWSFQIQLSDITPAEPEVEPAGEVAAPEPRVAPRISPAARREESEPPPGRPVALESGR